jgi:tRNA modification GTPase
MTSFTDTIAAIATPLGEGGLGIVRLSGPRALEIAAALFRSKTGGNLSDAKSHSCHFGRLTGDHPIDQTVLTLFRAPNSYTGEDVVEFSLHGNPFLLQEAVATCLRQGARQAGPGEFTQRAFLNGKLDLTQAEAVADLIRAKTEKTHQAALAQLEGRLAAQIRGLRDALLPLLAHLEVALDHSDEDHAFLDRAPLQERCAALSRSVDGLLKSAAVGKVLREGLRVALVGRPNVGKSSLLNALLREERAIVTPIAGTTRDTLEETLNWAGIPVVLTDTAGLREGTPDPVERLGIERTKRAVAQADLVLGLFDGSQPLSAEDEAVVETCAPHPHLWVVNKSDLPASWEIGRLSALNGGAPIVPVSAKTGAGLETLLEKVKDAALNESASASEAEWLLNNRHRDALGRAHTALLRAAEAAGGEAYEECVALELKTALGALGEVIGETTSEDLLGQIFSQFCIGK